MTKKVFAFCLFFSFLIVSCATKESFEEPLVPEVPVVEEIALNSDTVLPEAVGEFIPEESELESTADEMPENDTDDSDILPDESSFEEVESDDFEVIPELPAEEEESELAVAPEDVENGEAGEETDDSEEPAEDGEIADVEEISAVDVEEAEETDDAAITVEDEYSEDVAESDEPGDAVISVEIETTEDVEEPGTMESSEEIEDMDEFEEDWYEEFSDELEDEPELVFFEEEYELPLADAQIAALLGEPFVLSFETSGWVYLGDLLDDGILQLEKRQNGLYSTTFTFSILSEGSALLEFWSIDPLTDEDVYLHYEVTARTTERVVESLAFNDEAATEYEENEPEPEPETEEIPAESVKSVEATVPRETRPLESIDFTTFSADEINAFFSDAEYREYYGEEDFLYYEGKIRETHPGAKDIKRAVACYEDLVKKFPGSKWWAVARERAKYLRKHYYL